MATVLDVQWVQNPNAAVPPDSLLPVVVPKNEELYKRTESLFEWADQPAPAAGGLPTHTCTPVLELERVVRDARVVGGGRAAVRLFTSGLHPDKLATVSCAPSSAAGSSARDSAW